MLAKLICIATFLAASPVVAQTLMPTDRYALELSIVRDGVEVVAGRTLIAEDRTAEMSITDGDDRVEMNAELSPVQGDGDGDQLFLALTVTRGDDAIASPTLMVRKGGTARVQIGADTPAGPGDGLTVTLTPIAAK